MTEQTNLCPTPEQDSTRNDNFQLPKANLDAVLEQYHRPSNCDHLVSPKVNKVVWHQLNQAARTADNAMQRC